MRSGFLLNSIFLSTNHACFQVAGFLSVNKVENILVVMVVWPLNPQKNRQARPLFGRTNSICRQGTTTAIKTTEKLQTWPTKVQGITLFRVHPDNTIYFVRNKVRRLNEWFTTNYIPHEHIIMKVQMQAVSCS